MSSVPICGLAFNTFSATSRPPHEPLVATGREEFNGSPEFPGSTAHFHPIERAVGLPRGIQHLNILYGRNFPVADRAPARATRVDGRPSRGSSYSVASSMEQVRNILTIVRSSYQYRPVTGRYRVRPGFPRKLGHPDAGMSGEDAQRGHIRIDPAFGQPGSTEPPAGSKGHNRARLTNKSDLKANYLQLHVII
jgi:hypothetical protein